MLSFWMSCTPAGELNDIISAVERILQQRTTAADAAVEIDRAIEPVVLRGGREPRAGVIAPGAAVVGDVVHFQVVEAGLVVGKFAERAAARSSWLHCL